MDCTQIQQTLQDTIGLNADSVGEVFLERVIQSRMDLLGIDTVCDYSDTVNSSSTELEALIENVIVPETWFFRDRESFAYLRQYIQQEWLPDNQDTILRILSCPCSTGEEPYSIVMTLSEAGMNPEQCSIDAVDISRIGLDKAEKGVYRKDSFRSKEKEYRNRYFLHNNKEYFLDGGIKDSVHFYKGNILDMTTFPVQNTYHILFCKNLLIYLADEARKTILAHLDRLIVPEGLLFAGHTELFFFRQSGYELVSHSRSFACRKPGFDTNKSMNPRDKKRKQKAVSVRPEAPQCTPTIQNGQNNETVQENICSGPTLDAIRNLADNGALQKAFSLCEEYISENTLDADGYFLMGLISQAEDNICSAEEYYLKSVYLNPFYYEALVHLSLLYEQRGDTDKSSCFKKRVESLQMEKEATLPDGSYVRQNDIV